MLDNIRFTGDTHASHAAIMRYCNRPFKTVDEMDAALAKNINNSFGGKGGLLYHVGDFGWGLAQSIRFREMFNPGIQVILIRGNHDKRNLHEPKFNKLFIKVYDLYSMKLYNQHIVLCHYAMRTWDKMHYGTWNLFGHSHNTLPVDRSLLSMDVGVDTHNYKPYRFDEIKHVMDNERSWKPIDHHVPKLPEE